MIRKPTQPADPSANAARARLFLALWPTPDERAQLVTSREQWRWPSGCALVAAEQLHLTLHFIGAVDRRRLPEIASRLQVANEPCDIEFTSAELWPRGLAVLSATVIPPALAELHRQLGEALRALELPVESRRFRPHVTLARHALGALPPSATPRQRWQVEAYVLVESQGGSYRIERRFCAPPA